MGDNLKSILLTILMHLLKELLRLALNMLEEGGDVAPPPTDL
jgi:hypothetical protein